MSSRTRKTVAVKTVVMLRKGVGRVPLRLELAGRTDRGTVRPTNEDAYHVSALGEAGDGGLCIVADGMGGSNAGEVASQMAVSIVTAEVNEWFSRARAAGTAKSQMGEEAPEALAQAVLEANRQVYRAGQADPDKSGMGTTLTAALILGDQLSLVHVGDSRGLLLRRGRLAQMTVDHSVVAELMRSGTLTEQQAASHPHRNILTRALGTDRSLAVDIHQETLQAGDVVVLCSDGVTRHLDGDDFTRLTQTARSPDVMAEALVQLALERGGLDNLTCLVISYLGCCDQ